MSDLRTINTDNLIKNVFIDLLDTTNFKQITIKDICEATLISRSTFYHHYDNKYVLLDQLIADFTAKFKSLIEQRNQQLTENSLLIYLYKELFDSRKAFLTLLTISGKFEENLLQILKVNSNGLFTKGNFGVPSDFLADIYSHIALGALIWTLQNGYSQEVAAFLNNALNELMQKYRL